MSFYKQLSFSRRESPILAIWSALGFAWFVLGMMFLPSSKLYHQGLIFLFWLPGLAAWLPRFRASLLWDRWLLAGLLACVAWAALSVSWGGDSKRYKEMLYVILSAQAFVVLGGLYREDVWRLLACLAMLGSLSALWSIVDFYLLQGHPYSARLVGAGLLDHPILAAHLMGALGVLLLSLRSLSPEVLPRWSWLLACLAYFSFLVLTRSKGPLLALIVACLFFPVCAPSRGRILFAMLLLGGAIVAASLAPQFLLRGGLSYRPDLLLGAWELFLQHPWLGLGLGSSYELEVAAIGATYEHAHNLFAHIALQLGLPGLLLWLSTLLVVFWRGWSNRTSPVGLALCSLLGFSVVALMTDGIGPWVKPREEWFTVWLPIFLCFALRAGAVDERSRPT
ncbi:O-antigen ligase family protein [Pseudomonas sp. SP16.1]|uniref:O-antigen ligase family protein n=1 Tax=Pseudomonas sp. SP16.1 TaxID=3458854 RepID=UPI004045367E